MSWQTIEPNQNASLEPKLHVYADGDSYINAAADQKWFTDYEAVEIKVDLDGDRLGLVPRPESTDENYSLARDNDFGADISTRRALRRLGFEAGRLDSSETIPLQYDDGVIVADVAGLLPGETEPQHEIGTDGTATTAADVEGNGHAVAGPSPTESNADINLTPSGTDNTTSQTMDYETPDLDNETRQDILDYVLGVTAGGRTVLLESREIADELDMRGQTVAQHLRFLRDDEDLTIPVAISLEKDEDWPRHKWRLEGHESGGSTTADSTTSSSSSSGDLDLLLDHIDDGVDDVHDLAAETGLACDRIRSLTREAEVYGDLTDAPEDGGYGRA